MERKVKLSVLGFSFNQTHLGTYGLVLAEDEGIRRLMLVVGAPEAQSIAFKLQNSEPPRPLTHDLFQSVLNNFDIFLEEVVIHKYEDGIFYSLLKLRGADSKLFYLDSRTSDAVAMALRVGSPIYTTEDIMRELAVVVNESEDEIDDVVSEIPEEQSENTYSFFECNELEAMLDDAIEGEDYELASILRDEIQKKK